MPKKNVDLSFLSSSYRMQEEELPSKGLLYDKNPLNKGVVRIREMTTTEEKMMGKINKNNFHAIWTDIIKNCTGNEFDPEDLTLGDRNFILYWIRAKTYGSTYMAKITCPSCDEDSNSTIDIAEFDIRYLEEEDFEGEPLVFNLPKSGVDIKINIPRSRDFKRSTTMSFSQSKAKGTQISPIIYQKAICTVELQLPDEDKTLLTSEEDFELILQIIDKLPSVDSLKIEEEWAKYDHGIIDPLEKPCPHCGKFYEQYPIINAEFFRPDPRRSHTK